MSTLESQHIFKEAIDHCRWKKVLKESIIDKIDISDYKDKNFDEIVCRIHEMCSVVNGIGMLSVYDITAAICRFYSVNIEKVYIIGGGPRRAIKLLKMKTKIQKINKNCNIHFVEVRDVIATFDAMGFALHENIRTNKNGDILETYLCNWQKTIK